MLGAVAQEYHQSYVEMLILFIASLTGSTDDPLADLSEVLNTDDDILGILSDDLVKSGDHSGTCVCRVSSYFFFNPSLLYKYSLYYICRLCSRSFQMQFSYLKNTLVWKNFGLFYQKNAQPCQHFVLLGSALLLKRG